MRETLSQGAEYGTKEKHTPEQVVNLLRQIDSKYLEWN
jgi:hypothetical protein